MPINAFKTLILISIMTLLLSGCSDFCWADEIDDIIPYVIQAESGGNANAVSSCGAVGLMQITPIVLREYNNNVTDNQRFYREGYNKKISHEEWEWIPTHPENFKMDDMYDPHFNKLVGEFYLRRLRDYYLGGDYTLERLLCAWNGGITRLRKVNYDCSKMPKKSRNFSANVFKIREKALFRKVISMK